MTTYYFIGKSEAEYIATLQVAVHRKFLTYNVLSLHLGIPFLFL